MKRAKISSLITDKISGEWGEEDALSGIAVNVIRTANFTNSGVISFDEIVKREIEQHKVEKKKLNDGDVIIEKSGGSPNQPVGRVVYFKNPDNTTYLCNNFTTILRPDKTKVNPKYLFYLLFNFYQTGEVLSFQNKTTGIINLKLDRYLDSEINYEPDHETQNKIVAILDKAKAILDKREKTIQLYDELLRATFLEMFGDPVKNEKGWETSQLKEISKVRIGPFGSLLHQEDYIKDGTPIVNPSHISNGKIVVDWNLSVSKEKLKELSSYIMNTGDIVLGRRGEIGRCAVVTENENGFLCGTGSIFIRPNDIILSIFLYNAISTNSIKKVLEHSAKGVTMKNLNSGIVEDLKIPTPPLSLQRKFVTIIEKIEKVKAILITSKRKIENLVGCLSQQAFKGYLDFNTAVDLEVLLENDYETHLL